MPEWIGKTVGKVRIEKYLARGGMAEVYLGTHLTLERSVAVKFLHSFIEDDPGLLARFQREAKVVAGLRHNNIVQILDFDTADGHPYIVMEYLAGPSMAAYLRSIHERGVRLDYSQVARLLKRLGAALDYAHSQDIIHRDVKPANILLHGRGKADHFAVDSSLTEHIDPIITDFGLVRIAHSTSQTTTGAISGTPAYMSPEQARGDKVDHRTDIYSLGVVLYEMLAGRVPFEADSGMSVLYMHINEPPPPIKGLHPAIQNVIQRALAKKPDDRYQTCRELSADFSKAIEQSSQSETVVEPVSVPITKDLPLEPATVAQPPKRQKHRNWKGIISYAAGILTCVCGMVVLGMLFDNNKPPVAEPTEPHITKPTVVSFIDTLFPTEEETNSPIAFPPTADGKSIGVLRFQDGAAALGQVTISAALAPLPDDSRYEAWLIGDEGESRRSLGLLEQDGSGKFVLAFADPQGRNLIERYHHMEITLEANPDDNPNPSGQVIYSSGLPSEALVHVRHLLHSIDSTPNKVSLVHGMTDNTKLMVESVTAMQSAFDAGDEAAVRSNAEMIINLIVGKQDLSNYKDWDGDGEIEDPGDGYGLLLNGDQSGYILGTMSHAGFASGAEDATEGIRIHAQHVVLCALNLEMWVPGVRDTAIKIVQEPLDENMQVHINDSVALANKIMKGLDIDGNEQVDPIPGEGGVLTAYEHAYYMADMPILPGDDQIPLAAP